VTVHMSESSTKADVVRAVGERLGIDQSVIGTALGLAQPETTA
jgi:DNA-binding IclR family transcriptional regulator